MCFPQYRNEEMYEVVGENARGFIPSDNRNSTIPQKIVNVNAFESRSVDRSNTGSQRGQER